MKFFNMNGLLSEATTFGHRTILQSISLSKINIHVNCRELFKNKNTEK